MSNKGGEAKGPDLPHITSYFAPASMSPYKGPHTGPSADRSNPPRRNWPDAPTGPRCQPSSSCTQPGTDPNPNHIQPARKRYSIPPPTFYGTKAAQGQGRQATQFQPLPGSSGSGSKTARPCARRNSTNRITKPGQRAAWSLPGRRTQNSGGPLRNQGGRGAGPGEKGRPGVIVAASPKPPAPYQNLNQAPVVHYASSGSARYNGFRTTKTCSWTPAKADGGGKAKAMTTSGKRPPTAVASSCRSTSTNPTSSSSSPRAAPPSTAPSSSSSVSSSPPASQTIITSPAAMTDQQKIALLQMLAGFSGEYQACPYGDRSRETSFWTVARSRAAREHGLEFGSWGSLKKGVASVCRSRLRREDARGQLDALSRAIDQWNGIVAQRERVHAAQREEAGRSKRWAAVPNDVRGLARSRLDRCLSTLCSPSAVAADLEVASQRVAVVLFSEPPQFTQRYGDKVLGQLAQLRKERGAANMPSPSSTPSPSRREVPTPNESGRIPTPSPSSSPETDTAPPSPASSDVIIIEETPPREMEERSRSRKRKREKRSRSAKGEKEDENKKKKRKKSSSRAASDSDEPAEEQPPRRKRKKSHPPSADPPEDPSANDDGDGGGGDGDSSQRDTRTRHDTKNTLGRNQPLNLHFGSPSTTAQPTPKRAAAAEAPTTPRSSTRTSRSVSRHSSSRRPLTAGTDAAWPSPPSRSRPSSVLGDNGTERTRNNTPAPASARKPSASPAAAVTLPQSPHPSSPPPISVAAGGDEGGESPGQRRRRAQTDYESEDVSSIIQRHSQQSKQECKTLRKKCREIQAENREFKARLKQLEAIVLEREK